VTLVRQTEHQLLALGEPIKAFGLKTTECLAHTRTLSAVQRQRLTRALTTAMSHHDHIRQQSTRLTHGKKLRHCKLVNAYDLTIAPIIKVWPQARPRLRTCDRFYLCQPGTSRQSK
jgi:hypothetical protein